jgi:hypothetical protein
MFAKNAFFICGEHGFDWWESSGQLLCLHYYNRIEIEVAKVLMPGKSFKD